MSAWTIGPVTLNVYKHQAFTFTDADIGATIPVISGFTPASVGRSTGEQGEGGRITHVEEGATHQAVIDAINAIRTALKGFPYIPYHDMVCPHFSGRVRILSRNPTYPEPEGAAVGYLEIVYQVVHN